MTYPKTNYLKDLWEKWGEAYVKEKFRIHGIKRTPQRNLFTKYANEMLDLLLEETIERGEDVKTVAGSFLARQVPATSFRGKKYGRNFEIIGGREYTIFDLLKKGKYPVFTFRNSGYVSYRNWMWRCQVRPSVKWRMRLYQKFYDEGMEYRTMKYPTSEQQKRKKRRVIWRGNYKYKL